MQTKEYDNENDTLKDSNIYRIDIDGIMFKIKNSKLNIETSPPKIWKIYIVTSILYFYDIIILGDIYETCFGEFF